MMVRRRRTTRNTVIGAVIALSVGSWALVMPSAASAADIVCAGPTIQSCVDAASPGDTVVIPAGVYFETVELTTDVSLRGAGPLSTIIDATGLAARPLTVHGAAIDSGVVIEDLRLTGGDVSGGNICFPTPDNCGGGLAVFDDAQPTLRNITVDENRAYRGGGIHAEPGSALVLENVTVTDNAAVLSGGGINSSASLELHGSTVSGNESENNVGGGIRVGLQPVVAPLPTLLIEDSLISGNATGTVGGSIFDGGGISSFAFDVTIRRTEISGNSCAADCDGGGLAVLSNFVVAQLALDDVTVSGNSATDRGGGVSAGGDVSPTVVDSHFSGNSAAQGGGLHLGLFAFAPVQSVTDTVFVGNHVVPIGLPFNDGAGGGMFSQRCDGTFSGLTFTQNSAQDGGGFACAFNPLVTTGSTFAANTATRDGGGLHTPFGATLTGVDFNDNTADGDGGGAFVGGDLTVGTMIAARNQADGNGGALAVGAGALTVSGSSFASNRSDNEAAFFGEGGGAIHVVGDTSISTTTFTGNAAPTALGGALHVFGTLDLTDVTAAGNTAALGGAVYARGDDIDMLRVSMTGNSAVEATTAGGFSFGGVGGAAYLTSQPGGSTVIDVDSSDFQANQAIGSFARGGAIASDGELVVTDSTFVGNSTDGSGGAIAGFFAPMSITGSTITGNTAVGGSGGGVQASVGFPDALVVDDTVVSNNDAGSNGGGISLFGAIVTTDAVVSSNRALAGRGGGVDATGLYLDTDGTYDGNEAATDGGAIYANSNVSLDGTSVTGNLAGVRGGGVFANSSFSTIGASFEDNTAGGDGGGAFADFAHDIDGTTFAGNIAGGSGGGLVVDRRGPIANSTIAGNTATVDGGGLLITGAGTTAVGLLTSTVSGNAAGGNGGGVAVLGVQPVDIVNVTVSGNTAGAAGDGLSSAGGSAISLHHVTFGGAQPVAVAGTSGSVAFANTLVLGACAPAGASLVSSGGNLESPGDTCSFTGVGDQVGVGAPMVNALADNGGPTLTHALQSGSPAVDAGVAPCAAVDQRGVLRVDAGCDVGAFELIQATADAGGPYFVVEGSSVVLDGTGSSDDGGGALAYAWSPAANLDDPTSATPTYSGVDDAIDALTLSVTNSDGATDSDTATVTVTNAPPVITSLSSAAAPVAIADPVSLDATFTDAGVLDTHGATVDWGDGTTTSATVLQGAGAGTVSDSHTYSTPGVYSLELTVIDDDGGVATAVYEFVVVTGSTPGTVTGGGFIEVAAGDCSLDADCAAASGTANFGFVARYRAGAVGPTGSTEINFSEGGLDFHSDTYDWLIVDGTDSTAMYQGWGTVNRSAAPTGELYRFLVWIEDNGRGTTDTVRMRIWYETVGGSVPVYDSGVVGLSGGNVVVHGT